MINELIYGFYIIVDILVLFIGYSILKYYAKLRNLWPWFFIIISYFFDLLGNIPWLYYLLTAGEENIPYPSLMDFFWVLSYLLTGVGILLLWLNYLKIKEYKDLGLNMIIVFLLISLSGLFGYWLFLNDYFYYTVDVVYVIVSLIPVIVGFPLIILFRKGLLEKFWKMIVFSAIFSSLANTLWSYWYTIGAELWVADIIWIAGYSLFLYALIYYKNATIDVRRKKKSF